MLELESEVKWESELGGRHCRAITIHSQRYKFRESASEVAGCHVERSFCGGKAYIRRSRSRMHLDAHCSKNMTRYTRYVCLPACYALCLLMQNKYQKSINSASLRQPREKKSNQPSSVARLESLHTRYSLHMGRSIFQTPFHFKTKVYTKLHQWRTLSGPEDKYWSGNLPPSNSKQKSVMMQSERRKT